MKKYKYILEGLNCPNCARKIEESLKKNKDFQNVSVNFSMQTLTFEANKDLYKKVQAEVKKFEPNVKVLDENEKTSDNNKLLTPTLIRFILGVVIGCAAFFVKVEGLSTVLTILAYILLMYRTFTVAVKKIFKNKVLDENTLICISAVGAYLVNQHMEGIMVLALYEFGKLLEARAVNNTRKSIKELMNIRPEYANIKNGKTLKKVSPDQVQVGDIIVVKAGEKIALDGTVIFGNSNVNNSALTGESKYMQVSIGDKVLSGSINVDGVLEIKVDKKYSDSTVAKILELTQNATDRKAKTENIVSRIAKFYVPIVLILAIIVAIGLPLVSDITYSQSIYRGLIFLVISCPCAIAISVPLSYFCGIGKASSSGILIKGSDYLDALRNIKTIAMDKTGTLTTGKFSISKVESLNENYSESEVLNLCKIGESFSNHPIAIAIVGKDNVDTSKVTEHKELPGLGIKYVLDGKEVVIGNSKLVGKQSENNDSTSVYVSLNGKLIGKVELADSIKDEAKDAISELQNKNVTVKMFTGDNEAVAKNVGKTLGIQDIYYQMLPQDKYEKLEELINNKQNETDKVAFVGDGINDSPVLALADVGISMGGVGTNSAIEASDVVIMTDDLTKLNEAMEISRYTNRIVMQNLIFAIGTKVTFLILSTLGLTGMAFAVFADVGVTVINILNSVRILKKKK